MAPPTIEYYSVLERNELAGHEKTKKLKIMLLSGRSHSEKAAGCMILAV